MPLAHQTVVVVADDGTSPVGTDEWNLAHAEKYQPTEDISLLANSTSILNTDPFILDSGRLVTLASGATLWLDAPRPWTIGDLTTINVKDFGAKGNSASIGDVAITSATATLTSASNPWSPSDAGKSIAVGRAGAAAATLLTTISTFNHPGSVTLAANASSTVGGEYAVWGTDDTTAIQNAINATTAGGDVIFPRGNYFVSTTLTKPNDGIRLIGSGVNARWRASIKPTVISYVGTTAALRIVIGSAVVDHGIHAEHLQFDGTATAAAVDGVVLDASAAGVGGIEEVSFRNCTISNFGHWQFSGINTVFDISFYRCAMNNSLRAADNLVNIDQGAGSASQVTFDDCYMLPYTVGMWCVRGIGQDFRFIGGTYAPYAASTGAHGIWVTGGLSVYGSHIEGSNSTFSTNIGIRYEGSNGAFISPSFCSVLGIGIQIGVPGSAQAAIGWTIAGNVSNNNTGSGGFDIQIANGGQRRGQVINTGGANGKPVISNLRKTSDGVSEVLTMNYWGIQLLAGITSDAPLTFDSGSNLTAAAAGAMEYDGTAFYSTSDTTNGRRYSDGWNYFRLTGSGAGITTIADFFGTNDGIPLVASGVYEIEWHCYFSQVTAGTATWTIVTATTALANLTGEYIGSPIGGIGAVGTPQTAAINVTSSSSTAFPVTGTEATAVTHYFTIRVLATAGAGASNTRLRLTMGAGTATPLINSYFRVRRLAGANVGTYVA